MNNQNAAAQERERAEREKAEREKTEREKAEREKTDPQDPNKAEREKREHEREAETGTVIVRDRVFDPGTVIVQNTYRVGFMPPQKDSLTLGELYIELGEGKPRMWIGIQNTADLSSNIANIEERIEHGVIGTEKFDPKVDRGPVVLIGGDAQPRDPPLPATPADALPITQQNLVQQYQNRDPDHPYTGQEGQDQRRAYDPPSPPPGAAPRADDKRK